MSALRVAWRWWTRVAHRIGDFQAGVILTVFYYLILGPFALVLRRRDPLGIGPRAPRGWRPREASPRAIAEQATVREDTAPRYHRLIEPFGKATGVPVLLSTSFNLKGEPIVNTPAEALPTFGRSGMDVLVLGDTVVEKRGSGGTEP
jgi:carbamoyltransferase